MTLAKRIADPRVHTMAKLDGALAGMGGKLPLAFVGIAADSC
jgi:hypothetical protein